MNLIRVTTIAAFVIICSALAGCGAKEKGEEKVDRDIAIEVQALDPDNEKSLDALVAKLRQQSLNDLGRIVELLHGEDEKTAENAAALLLEMLDMAITPLLDNLPPEPPEQIVWDLQTILDGHITNQSRIVKQLESLLGNQTPLEPDLFPLGVEEMPPLRRVCDEAYLMLRRLIAFEDEETELMNADAFLELDESGKDDEIKRLKQTGKWEVLFDRIDEPDRY